MIYFQSLTQKELAELLKSLSQVKARAGISIQELETKKTKQAQYRAKQIFHWVYQRLVTNWDEMTDLSKDLRAWLKENVEILRLPVKRKTQSNDGTQKFLWSLKDQETVESVIIPAGSDEDPASRLTACISSQVGCAMACKFCLTGMQRLTRNLEAYEIVVQVFELRKIAQITNIVFMGMGEPLHNLKNVIKACQILLDPDGFSFSKRKVTVSTSGLVPAIEKLGQAIDVSLAISLNATTDEQRSQIMPVNKKWKIKALLDACRKYPLGSHRRITFEYVLLNNFNDSLEDAARLTKLLKGIPCKINLIPYNQHSGLEYERPSDSQIKAFQRYLLDRGFTATIRISKGQDILAACGQLRSAAS